MKKISISFLLLILIIGCAKTKEQVAEKCLLQANQTFDKDLFGKIEFFNSCMLESQYHYIGGKDKCREYLEAGVEKLSSYCYEYKIGY